MSSYDSWLTEPYERAWRDSEAEVRAIEEIADDPDWICQGDSCHKEDPCQTCIQAKFTEWEDAHTEHLISQHEDRMLFPEDYADDWGD